MALFEKKKQVSRKEFLRELEKAPSSIPGTSKRYSKEERVKTGEELFGKKYSGDTMLSEEEYKKDLERAREKSYRAKTSAEKQKISRAVRYFEKYGGVKKS